MKRHLSSLTILLAGLLAGCNMQTTLNYRPSDDFALVAASQPLIGGVVVADHRSEDPHRLATNLPTYGNPLVLWNSAPGTLDTELPVKDEVARVFGEALTTRNQITRDPSAPLLLTVDLFKFDADHYLRSQARISMTITLVDRRTNQPVYRDQVEDQTSSLELMGSNLGDLQMRAELLLDRAVDRLLANPGFLAIAAPRAPMQANSVPGMPSAPPPFNTIPYAPIPAPTNAAPSSASFGIPPYVPAQP